ncbi:glycosyltransferase, partial [Desemzia sp. C1]|nr:glycosyltransferase [Desemzia sp. C1]
VEQGISDDVYAIRRKREGESKLKKLTSKTYYKLFAERSKKRSFSDAGGLPLVRQKMYRSLISVERNMLVITNRMYNWRWF